MIACRTAVEPCAEVVIRETSTSSADLNLSYARTMSALVIAEPSVPPMKLVDRGTEPDQNSDPDPPVFVNAPAAVLSTPHAIHVFDPTVI